MTTKRNAQILLEESIAIKKRIGSKTRISLNNLGYIFVEQGEWEKATSCWIKASENVSES